MTAANRAPGCGRVAGVAVVAVIALVVALYAWAVWPSAVPTVDLVVPDGYRGFLAVRWACPGGVPLERVSDEDGGRYRLAFGADGAACVADALPDPAFTVGSARYAGGGDAPVLLGPTRRIDGAGTDGGAAEGDYVFSIDAVGSADGRTLGDECGLSRFLEERFGVPPPAAPTCEPILGVPAQPPTPAATATDAA